MSMGYVDKLTETNITCMEEICRNKKKQCNGHMYRLHFLSISWVMDCWCSSGTKLATKSTDAYLIIHAWEKWVLYAFSPILHLIIYFNSWKLQRQQLKYLKSRIRRPWTSNTPRAPLTNAKAKLSHVSSEFSAPEAFANKNRSCHLTV